MICTERDVISLFSDSQEIADALRDIADDLNGNYWLQEAASHIEGLYTDACDMQRIIKRLRAEVAKLEAKALKPSRS